MNYTLDEALNQYDADVDWLQEAGILDKDYNLSAAYDKLMQGKLNLPVHAEIAVLRRIERMVSLGHWIDYLRTSKAKFRA
jgi:hypothetical protein